MSLINDALKRAKQAQHEANPGVPPPLHLRPVEPREKVIRGVGLVLPGALALVALLVLLLVWQVFQRKQDQSPAASSEVVARALTSSSSEPQPVAQPETVPSPVEPAPAAPPAVAQPAATAAVRDLPPEPAPAPIAQTQDPSLSPTNAAPVPVVKAPEPPPLRLQSIIFNPTRPSAMVNGKLLFVGDRINQLRVAAITASTVTLTGAGATNLLELAN